MTDRRRTPVESPAQISRRFLLTGAALVGGAALAGPALWQRPGWATPQHAREIDGFSLPNDFYWGVATSGYQCEGSEPDSNWSRYVADQTASIEDPYLNSVDFRHRYPDDIERARDMGVNVFRTSIEWARVQPEPGVWDQSALAYYDDLITRVRNAGATPMITLDHWVYPGWVLDQGAWDNPQTVEDWLAFARMVVNRYRDEVSFWITVNEPNVYVRRETSNRGLNPAQVALMYKHLIEVHRHAYDMIHRLAPEAMVSSNTAYIPGLTRVSDARFLDHVRDKLDFLGFDYYYGVTLDNPTAMHALTGELWKIESYPRGIYEALHYYQQRFPQLPLYVVENGMPTDNGKPRPDGYTRSDHLRDHIYWVQRAHAEGVHVIGYNYWSITDNYEWGSYRPRFGLYTVDVLTNPALTRQPTDAVATYRRLIRDGGVPSAYVPAKQGYCSIGDPVDTCIAPEAPVPLH